MARILIVDDEEQVCSIVSRLARINGHTVDTALDGNAALERLQSRTYDLLIIDNLMPKLTGVDAVAIIRSTPRFRGMRILMFSGATVTRDIDQAFEAGVDGYIPKPFCADRLIAKINGALQRPGQDAKTVPEEL
jgi:DNA-binding response OmpR family regulator